MYLLDTSIISELRRPVAAVVLVRWLSSVADSDLHLSAVTLGEIQASIEVTRDHDAVNATEMDQWMDSLSGAYNILPVDAETFRIWSRLMHGSPDAIFENAMIAATAKKRGLIVATRNISDFEQFQVPLFNPFESA